MEIRFSIAMAKAVPSHIQNLRYFYFYGRENYHCSKLPKVIGKILSLSIFLFYDRIRITNSCLKAERVIRKVFEN